MGLERELLVRLGPSTDVRSLAAALERLDSVERAAPNRLLSLARTPDDPSHRDQWGHDDQGQAVSASGTPVGIPGFDTDADLAWDGPQGFGVSGVVIGVIDSGVDLDHPDLLLAPGFDFIENDDQAQPDTSGSNLGSHGTKVAGMAAALADNGIGVAGSCGGCSIMPLRVTILGGAIVETCAADAIVWAVDHGARVVNMSFGITESGFFDAATEYASLHDVVLIAASGNGNLGDVWYPARHPLVIAVGAASPCGERKRSSSDPLGTSCDRFDAWGSSYGTGLDFLAPGVANPTTTWNQGYDPAFWDTSSAAPYLAGVAGLLLSHRPTLTPAQVKQALAATATDVVELPGDEGYDIRTGWGLVDAEAALAEPPLPECADGVDNDGDGWIDHPEDPECTSPADSGEGPGGCGLGVELGLMVVLSRALRRRARRQPRTEAPIP